AHSGDLARRAAVEDKTSAGAGAGGPHHVVRAVVSSQLDRLAVDGERHVIGGEHLEDRDRAASPQGRGGQLGVGGAQRQRQGGEREGEESCQGTDGPSRALHLELLTSRDVVGWLLEDRLYAVWVNSRYLQG